MGSLFPEMDTASGPGQTLLELEKGRKSELGGALLTRSDLPSQGICRGLSNGRATEQDRVRKKKKTAVKFPASSPTESSSYSRPIAGLTCTDTEAQELPASVPMG